MHNLTLDFIRKNGKAALAHALADLERFPDAPETLALLDSAFQNPIGRLIGITGPPGVGKSTLIAALIKAQITKGKGVAIIAVDPSSARSGGALLGDRARFGAITPTANVFVRSLASRGHLGGVAELAFPIATLFQSLYDLVIIETVGVGQSEMEIRDLADYVALCLQPGAGDSLQFMKAGIMEIPDLAIITKADMKAEAARAAADFRAAARVFSNTAPEILMVSAQTGQGIEETLEHLSNPAISLNQKRAQYWLHAKIQTYFGTYGLKIAQQRFNLIRTKTPFITLKETIENLEKSFTV